MRRGNELLARAWAHVLQHGIAGGAPEGAVAEPPPATVQPTPAAAAAQGGALGTPATPSLAAATPAPAAPADAGGTTGDESAPEELESAFTLPGGEKQDSTEPPIGEADAKKQGDTPKAEVPSPFTLPALPEGMQADTELLGKLSPWLEQLKGKQLTQELFEEGLHIFAAHQQERAQAASKDAAKEADRAYREQGKEWLETIKSNEEFGGARYEESKKLVGEAIVRFGGPVVAEILQQTGLERQPDIWLMFAKMGKAFRERPLVTGETGGETEKDERALRYSRSQKK